MTDAIELYNPTDRDIDIGGWFLSDSSGNLRKYSIPAATTIPSHGYIVFDEHDFNPGRWNPLLGGFGLDSAGEELFLTAADADGRQLHFVDHIQFGAAHVGESFGRWPDGAGELFPMNRLSLGEENSGPRVGPVIISELMYHPREPGVSIDPEQLEFIEVYNPSDAPVDLTDWRIADGIEFQFADGTTLAPRDTIVVTAFDPRDANMLRIFRYHYRLDESVTVLGPFTGRLSNAGNTVQLLRAERRQPDRPDEILLLLEDVVRYDDEAPWASQPDGYGHSLHRRAATLWGNDVRSWVSAWPTPGMGVLAAGDANRDGRFTSSDLVQVFQWGEYEDEDQA